MQRDHSTTHWKLKRTRQCEKCPWRKEVNPLTIPNDYDPEKHENLISTIAEPGDFSSLADKTLRIMACHETHDTHCVGWLYHQLGEGNNIPLRLQMLSCTNLDRLKIVGEQHEDFEDTLP